MAEELHNSFLHVMIDCNTGDGILDKSIEHAILGYANLVVYCLGSNNMDELLKKTSNIANEFKKREEQIK